MMFSSLFLPVLVAVSHHFYIDHQVIPGDRLCGEALVV